MAGNNITITVGNECIEVDRDAPVRKTLRQILIARGWRSYAIVIDGKVVTSVSQLPRTFKSVKSCRVVRMVLGGAVWKEFSGPVEGLLGGDAAKGRISDDERLAAVEIYRGEITIPWLVIDRAYFASSPFVFENVGLYIYFFREYIGLSNCVFKQKYSPVSMTIHTDTPALPQAMPTQCDRLGLWPLCMGQMDLDAYLDCPRPDRLSAYKQIGELAAAMLKAIDASCLPPVYGGDNPVLKKLCNWVQERKNAGSIVSWELPPELRKVFL